MAAGAASTPAPATRARVQGPSSGPEFTGLYVGSKKYGSKAGVENQHVFRSGEDFQMSTTPTPTLTSPHMGLPHIELIEGARRALSRAAMAGTPHERYAAAHLAALRAAAAVIAAVAPGAVSRGKDHSRQRVRSAWVVLREVCPPMTEWADFFAAGARTRAAAEAGIPCVSHRAADDLVRDAETFLARVCDVLELAYQPALESRLRAVG